MSSMFCATTSTSAGVAASAAAGGSGSVMAAASKAALNSFICVFSFWWVVFLVSISALELRRAGRSARDLNIGKVPVHRRRAISLVSFDQECGLVAAEMQAVAGRQHHLLAVEALGDGAFEHVEDFLALMADGLGAIAGRHVEDEGGQDVAGEVGGEALVDDR